MNTLNQLKQYMGKRKALLPLALLLSAAGEAAGLLPCVFICLTAKSLLEAQNGFPMQEIADYAVQAAGWAVAGVALYFLGLTCSHLVAFRVECNLRREAMRRIAEMPLGFFDANASGRIRKIIDDNASITHSFLAHQLPDLAGSLLVPLMAVALAFTVNWVLGVACLIPLLAASMLMTRMTSAEGQAFMQAYMTSLEEMNTAAVEYVRGIPVIKVFQQTVRSFKALHKSIMDYRQMAFSYTNLWENPMSCYTAAIHSFVFFLAPTAILLAAHGGHPAEVLTDFLLFVLVTPVFSQSIMKTMYLSEAQGQAREAIARMERLLDYPKLPQPEHPQQTESADVSFDHVSFRYPGTTKKAVDDVSFTIRQGQKVALVGASGSGKTTIARLLPRFYEAEEGCIRIGGTDIRQIGQKDLMRSVSFVFQNLRLFKGTLRENIVYARPDARPEEIDRAVKLAQCQEIVERLPRGLDTIVGTEGIRLSGGERQRIALARAILKDAPVIVLDEATAFADPENERLIQLALKTLTKGKTVLAIAHRLSSVTDADRILVIDKGRVVEEGRHEELLQRQGTYRKMWDEYRQAVCWTIRKEDRHD